MISRWRSLRADDSGMTLVELLIGMILLSMVSALVAAAAVSASAQVRHTSNETQGLDDTKKVVERLGRDIRDARSVALGADAHHLVLWIDYNSDYIQQPLETITWQLVADSTSPGHYDVVRSTGAGQSTVEATTLISNLAFTYDAAAPATRLVNTTMTYNPILNLTASSRQVTFSERLRNVA